MSRSGGRRPLVAPRALDAVQIDAVEQHLQVGGADLDALSLSRGKTEGAHFEPLVEDDETVFVPVEEFDAVSALIAEDEELTGKRVVLELLANQLGQGVERFAQVGGTTGQPDAHGGGQAEHHGCPSSSRASRRWRVGPSKAGPMRKTRRPWSINSSPVAAQPPNSTGCA